jgi:NADH pyrophosphatase NudC (nudix superfamily)
MVKKEEKTTFEKNYLKKGQLSANKDTNNKILAIVFSDQNKFLLLKTNPKHMKLSRWYVVTGSVKKNESYKEAVRREVEEETKLKIIKIFPTSLSWTYEWPKGSKIIKNEKGFFVLVKHASPKITLWEHTAWKWLSKKDFLKKVYWYGESKKNIIKSFHKVS